MKPSLPYDLFSNLKFFSEKFQSPINILDFFGSTTSSLIEKILNDMKVKDKPVVFGRVHSSAVIEGSVFIDKNVVVEPHVYIKGPAYIGYGSEVRHSAYIRGNTYIGKYCVVGHTTEVKDSYFLDYAKAGHFAYIGNSLLAQYVNLGAGTKLANLNLSQKNVRYLDPLTNEITDSRLKKFGSILGDHSQTGCNAVLSPGSLLLPKTGVYPCAHFKGTLTKGFYRH